MITNLTQFSEDVVTFIANLDWPEMYPVGRSEDGSILVGPNGEKCVFRVDEHHVTLMMYRKIRDVPVFRQFVYIDEPLLHRAVGIEFMEFCTS